MERPDNFLLRDDCNRITQRPVNDMINALWRLQIISHVDKDISLVKTFFQMNFETTADISRDIVV